MSPFIPETPHPGNKKSFDELIQEKVTDIKLERDDYVGTVGEKAMENIRSFEKLTELKSRREAMGSDNEKAAELQKEINRLEESIDPRLPKTMTELAQWFQSIHEAADTRIKRIVPPETRDEWKQN